MAKAKLKREKRELEKLQRAGRYLEWLEAVREMPVTIELKREIDKAWAEVRRRTLRTRDAFEEYCHHRSNLGSIPKNPENTFLEAMADLMANVDGASEAVLAVSGLSGAYQAAQQHLATILRQQWKWDEIKKLLNRMAHEPNKISKKQYQSLAASVAGSTLEEPFEMLGRNIMVFRRLNHKTNLHKRLSSKLLNELDRACYNAWKLTEWLPQATRRLILFPFVMQVMQRLRHANTSDLREIRILLGSIWPFLLIVAGSAISDDLQQKIEGRPHDDCSDAACRKLEQQFNTASFEQRLAMLRDFRKVVRREIAQEEEALSQFSWNFDGGVSEAMERLLIRFYREVVREISRRMPALATRDRRALAAFIDRILAEDMGNLLSPDADLDNINDLIHQAFEAGCGGVRLSMLAPFAAVLTGSRRLATVANQALSTGPVPSDEDLQWFIDDHLRLILRSPRHLHPLFARIRSNADQMARLAQAVRNGFATNLIMDELMRDLQSIISKNMEMREPVALSPTVLKELTELAIQIPELMPLRHFLQVFPKGRINADLLRKWCETAWTPDGDCHEFFQIALSLVKELRNIDFLSDDLYTDDLPLEKVAITIKIQQVLAGMTDFLFAHTADFSLLSPTALSTLVKEIFPYLEHQHNFASLLARTHIGLCTQIKNGETALAPLRDWIVQHIQIRAMPGTKKR